MLSRHRLLEGLTEMIIYKMISAVSKNSNKQLPCNYYWTYDYFTHIILPSEDHYCFSDMIGPIKSSGLWRLNEAETLHGCHSAAWWPWAQCRTLQPPGGDGRSLPFEDLTASEAYPSGQVAHHWAGNMKETQAQALEETERGSSQLPAAGAEGWMRSAERPSCSSGWEADTPCWSTR